MASMMFLRCIYCWLWTYFTYFFSVPTVDLEQVSFCWELPFLMSKLENYTFHARRMTYKLINPDHDKWKLLIHALCYSKLILANNKLLDYVSDKATQTKITWSFRKPSLMHCLTSMNPCITWSQLKVGVWYLCVSNFKVHIYKVHIYFTITNLFCGAKPSYVLPRYT